MDISKINSLMKDCAVEAYAGIAADNSINLYRAQKPYHKSYSIRLGN